jgi:hypothetical protein
MSRMSGFRRSRAVMASLPLTLLFAFGCSRRGPEVPSEDAAQTSQTPFQSQDGSGSESDLRTPSKDNGAPTGPPFQNSEILPAGTLLTVSLKTPVVAGNESKDSFEAMVDVPVMLDGNVAIPRGSSVSGRIEAAHISKVQPDRGYVRLALDSVHIDGSSLPVQTASLFARQLPPTDAKVSTIRLEKGRRLTFQLTEPLYFAAQRAKSDQ